MSAHAVIVNLTTPIPMVICRMIGEYVTKNECAVCDLEPKYVEFIEEIKCDVENRRKCCECMSNRYSDELDGYCSSCGYDAYCCSGCMYTCNLCKQEYCSSCLKDNLCSCCTLISNHMKESGISDKKEYKVYYDYLCNNVDDETDKEFIERNPYHTIKK